MPFEKYICEIGQRIMIKDEDKAPYTYDYDIIRDYILYNLRDDDIFNKLYKGPSLFGSYANNVRIKQPSEFDVHITLSPPYARDIVVEPDDNFPGFVNLNFCDVLDSMSVDSNYEDVYDFLYDATDEEGYLIRGAVQRWLHELFLDVFKTYGNKVKASYEYTLEYSKRGLAHTIFARCHARYISIDFVPAFICGQSDWMNIPTNRTFQHKCDKWYAVPKPIIGYHSNKRIAFMICNPKAEHHLLLKRYNLKVVFRLLKALRDAYGLKRLKSYFITTVFLWEIECQEESFWQEPVGEIFIHMLGVLTDYFLEENLPFFWNKGLNLLDVLEPDEIEDYAESLCSAFNKLKSYIHQPKIKYSTVLNHFE